MESFELDWRNYTFPKKKSRKLPRYVPIVGVKNGKLFPFDSCYHAARFLKAKNERTMARNILKVCKGERNSIMGIVWYFERDIDKYKEFI